MYLCDYEYTYHRKPFKNEETTQLFSFRAGAARPKQNEAFFMQWAMSLTPPCHLASVCWATRQVRGHGLSHSIWSRRLTPMLLLVGDW